MHQKIVEVLNNLHLSDEAYGKILNALNTIKDKESLQGIYNFLNEITASKSVRENYYEHSDFIAEYYCTLSNLGLFAVACYHKDYATLFAATFSALSHAIPSQRLHDLDMAGVLLIFGKVMMNYNVFIERPSTLFWGAGALCVNLLDTLVTRNHLGKVGPVIHVAWHFAAALALYKFNEARLDIIEQKDINDVLGAISGESTPSYLEESSQQLMDYMPNSPFNSHTM